LSFIGIFSNVLIFCFGAFIVAWFGAQSNGRDEFIGWFLLGIIAIGIAITIIGILSIFHLRNSILSSSLLSLKTLWWLLSYYLITVSVILFFIAYIAKPTGFIIPIIFILLPNILQISILILAIASQNK
jgi:hypothetical protein